MRILVTGHTGLLGRALLPQLRAGHEVTGVHSRDFDICDRGALRERLEAMRPDTVVHLAAMTAVDDCEARPDEAFRINTEGSRVVAEEAERVGAAILTLSTDYVFDGSASRPYREDDPPGPKSVYGESNLRGEERIRDASSAWTVVRSAWFFGPGGRNFVSRILELLKTEDTLSVVADQVGSPTFTEDLARGIRTLIESGARGVFHVVNTGQASWFDLARRAVELDGQDPDRIRPGTTRESGRPAARPAYSVLDPAKAAASGVRLRPWPEALAEYLEE